MSLRALLADERAIEGLPIRLVVAFIVGITTLSVMLNMVTGIGGFAVNEIDAKPSPEVMSTTERDVEVAVVDAEGDPVEGATVIVRSDTASIGGIVTGETDANGTATLRLDPELGPNQRDGTLEIDLKPPGGSEYTDKRANTEILVLAR